MINLRFEYVYLRDIEESPINAQEMSEKDFNRLVENLKIDKALTSSVLLMDQSGKKKYMCISGHHRIKAAIKAGIEKVPCLIMDEVDESTRIRLQLIHNDIHGTPNEDIVSTMQQMLSDLDIKMVDTSNLNDQVKKASEVDYDIPNFQYVNICLLDDSRKSLVDLITNLENSETERWIIEKKEYSHLTDLLTIAFRAGFKTPGQAFRKFLDIIEENKDLICK